MQYFLILTKECNLLCSYCGGGSDTQPKEIRYKISDLKSFLARDDNPVLEFYGGEPLLRIKTMQDVMESVSGRFMVQTNGIFLDRLEPEVLEKLHSVLVSIDGTRDTTDRERGRGVYDRVLQNVRLVRQRGFRGDLVARMTVVQGSRLEENVIHLLNLGLFDHVHWQLSFSMFWEAGVNNDLGLAEWIDAYNTGTSHLVRWWVDEMERTGRVPGIVPFIGLMRTILSGGKSQLRCGSGLDFFAILPDGRISACPVSIDYDFSVVGSIFESTPRSLRGVVSLGEPCLSCDILGACGGRCLFVNRFQSGLRRDGYHQICRTVRHLVAELQEAAPCIRTLLADGVVKETDFEYPELNNGCEIIP